MCREYGWDVEYVLSMPVPRFYVMFREAKNMRQRRYLDLCDIAIIPSATDEYIRDLKQALRSGITTDSIEPVKPQEKKILSKEEAEIMRAKVFQIFKMQEKYGR